MQSNKNKFWKDFQNFVGNAIPNFIVNVLSSAGYDSALSIADLNESDISIIQNHISNNAHHLLKEHVSYADKEKLVFLPGHKKLILGLRTKVQQFIDFSKQKVKTVQTASNVDVAASDKEQSEQSTELETAVQIELLSEEEIHSLKEELISKLNKVKQSIGSFDADSIVAIDPYISNNSKANNSKTASYKCSVKCCSCSKIVPCTYNKRWETSNLEKHLKSHQSQSQIPLIVQQEIDKVLGYE